MPDPEETSWEQAGDNPTITVETQLQLRLEEEETQPYRMNEEPEYGSLDSFSED